MCPWSHLVSARMEGKFVRIHLLIAASLTKINKIYFELWKIYEYNLRINRIQRSNVQYQTVPKDARRSEEIAFNQIFALARLDIMVELARTVLHFLGVAMVAVMTLLSAIATKVGVECIVTYVSTFEFF